MTKEKSAGSGTLVLPFPSPFHQEGERGESNISNPRVLSDMGLAIPTGLRNNNNNIILSSKSERPLGFEPHSFETYLKAQKKRNLRQIMCYAQRYHQLLETGNCASLVNLQSGTIRRHSMEALTELSKFLGVYDNWCIIRKRYQLHWSDPNDSLKPLEMLFDISNDTESNFDAMLQQIRIMVSKTSTPMGQVIKFGTLVGLRSAEIIESVKLINDKEAFPKYYDPNTMTLSHWKFKEQFLRRTKKAFQSFATPAMIELVKMPIDKKIPTYNAIRHKLRRLGLHCDIGLCRKVFATHLRQSGIAVEIIDGLQGRIPTSVFAKHYYRLSLDYRSKVLDAIEELSSEIG
jgi:hypothetical protein